VQAASKVPAVRDLRLFDSCVTVGRVVLAGCPECFADAAAVLAMMDRYDIAEALVHDHHARVLHPRANGNRRVLDLVRGQPRLHPVWVIEPPKLPGSGPVQAMVEEMLAVGVRAARLRMRPIPPLAWLWEDLCTVLEEHRVPCFVDFGSAAGTRGDLTDTDIDGLRDLVCAHPALPLILSHHMGGLGIHCAVIPLVLRTPNLYIDITGILEFWREVARTIGPERVLFATGAPFTDPGILVANVQYAEELDESAKRLICGDNLRRLLAAVR
jgi:hypothetical protein